MRLILLFAVFSLQGNAFAQTGAYAPMNEPVDDQVWIDVIYGSHIYNHNFRDQFNHFNGYEFWQPIQSVGFSMSAFYFMNSAFKNGFHYSYAQIIPQKIHLSDTLSARINGFNFSLSLASLNLTPRSKHTNISFGIGFNAGRLRMVSDGRRSQKNPYFAPALFFSPRFFLGRVVLGLRAEYQFDVSRKTWRSVNFSKEKPPFALDEFRQTGLIANFTVGWRII